MCTSSRRHLEHRATGGRRAVTLAVVVGVLAACGGGEQDAVSPVPPVQPTAPVSTASEGLSDDQIELELDPDLGSTLAAIASLAPDALAPAPADGQPDLEPLTSVATLDQMLAIAGAIDSTGELAGAVRGALADADVEATRRAALDEVIAALPDLPPDGGPATDGADGVPTDADSGAPATGSEPQGFRAGPPQGSMQSTRVPAQGDGQGTPGSLGAAIAGALYIVDGIKLPENGSFGGSGSTGDLSMGISMTTGGSPAAPREFSFTMKVEREGLMVEVRMRGRISGDPCPDADGIVSAEFELEHGSDVALNGVTGTGAVNIRGRLTATVDDSARLAGLDVDANVGARRQAPGRNSYIEAQVTRAYRGSFGEVGNPPSDGDISVTASNVYVRTSRDARNEDVPFVNAAVQDAEHFAIATALFWQLAWRSGACVKVAMGAPATVSPRASTEITVTVHHRDGEELALPVDLEVSGEATIAPDRIDPAPGAFTYTAGANKTAGTVTATSTSRRGIGTATATIRAAAQSYIASGGADALVVTDQVICDLEAPFVLVGSGVTQQFTPDPGSNGLSGSYTYSGNIGGFGVSGSGTYTVTFPDGPNLPPLLTASGPGAVETPMGTMTGEGTEVYRLVFVFDVPECATP